MLNTSYFFIFFFPFVCGLSFITRQWIRPSGRRIGGGEDETRTWMFYLNTQTYYSRKKKL